MQRAELDSNRLGFALPDLPRWVEAHGLLAHDQTWIERWAGGAMVGNPDALLAVACGRLDAERVRALAARHPDYHLLCAPEEELALPRRERLRAELATLAEPVEHPGELVGLLADTDALDHVAEPLRQELRRALRAGPVWAAWVEGAPVSFAYAPWRSSAWFDVSVDTLPGYRQLGLGALVCRALIADEADEGRGAVWGATEDNLASLRLAASLGFRAVDALWVYLPTRREHGVRDDDRPGAP